MNEIAALAPGIAHRTKPIGLLINAVGILRQLVFPLIIAIFTLRDGPMFQWVFGFGGVAIVGFSLGVAYVRWRRRTFTIGDEDIRVESGVFSRSATSVPYERIQDVSLEQSLLPRLLGLVSVKFETGAGGADELSLAYLSQEEGELMRRLVRERRDEQEVASAYSGEPAAADHAVEEAATPLFAMDARRLFTFGVFEFSLAVFAVLGGVLQYVDNVVDFEIWDVDFWRDLAEERGGWLLELGAYSQALGAVAGLFAVFLIGSATGLARTFAREWGFLLERTARGFRRRRGLFTRTDVVMPIHRVQGITIGTRFIRYRFGWHSLKFVSLAQDAGASSHVVAPFAKLDELDPIVEAAGYHQPKPDAQWHLATQAYRNVSILSDVALFAAATLIAGIVTGLNAPEWVPLAIAIPLALGAVRALASYVSWRFKRHALDDSQIIAVAGVLAPTTRIATRVKLHSVEVSQGPFARRLGYATLHLGMAGGEFSVPGIPVERAREVRAQVLETIAATDFSQLEAQRLAA
ncbi:MAG: PH domain-containing protein [Pseudomonadota bacterium]